ncbi:hypothetical protein N7468_003737 [Penicillium chermesinum]|uniref:Methyltransferase domain-containing protein n=1 Tax=Penicillium chermesinum TaxID=63820 RepID=A0A9W9P725_9EURO|nr:uncharacterized protein N7468_003737 [Penicillium chermesinum]KAJ5239118.1 hypothetical protein N7468_003737 [Penicillium chermesinum]
MISKTEAATYTHGHHASVLRSHAWRTAQNSAAFLLPYLQPHMKILDLGCGPGTITVDLATYVPEGHVTGLERVGDVLAKGRALAAERGVTNVEFVEGDGNGLTYADGTFDVVFAHQVLQHVADPVGMLREMKRVVKTGGIVAARDADYGSFAWFPELPGLRAWMDLYQKVGRYNGAEPNAGRMMHSWARQAGLPKYKSSVTSWVYTGAEDGELAGVEDLERISKTWKEWQEDVDAWITIPSSEIVCIKEH